jgi:tetratricopeptide (TPR) repeat protein
MSDPMSVSSKSPGASGPPRGGSRTGVRPGRRRGFLGHDLVLTFLLTALLALAGWQVVHSEALVEARAAFEGRDPPLHLQSLWSQVQKAWRGSTSRSIVAGPVRPNTQLALQRALDHLDRRPRDPEAARLAALCLTKLDYADRAEPYYRTARAGGALSPEDFQTRAQGLARGNFRDQAIEAFREILDRRPDDVTALQSLAALYYSQTRLKEALATAERLARAPGGAVPGYALIGVVCHDDHKFDQATAAYEQVLALDPDLSGLSLPRTLFYTDLAQDLLDAGRPADARRHLERALSREDDPVLVDLLGSAYRAEGRDAEAESCWKKAAESDPKLFRPWLNLGSLALATDRPAEAVAFLEKAHALGGGGALEPTYLLGVAYGRAGRPEDARRFQKKAEEIRRKTASDSLSKRKPPGENP